MSREGETAVLIPFVEADGLVETWRSAASEPGLPAHVTLLAPFVPRSLLRPEDVASLDGIFAKTPSVLATFDRCGRFPDVLYLAPEPADYFRRLTNLIAGRWPDFPPYEGAFEDVIPHFTIAHGIDEAAMNVIERELVAHLPYAAPVVEAWLMSFDGESWHCDYRFACGREQRGSST